MNSHMKPVLICTQNGEVEVETEFEFLPVEHPIEPLDEDRPVKCPMQAASSVVDKGETKREERSLLAEESMLVKSEETSADVVTQAPARLMRKRHHTLTNGDYTIAPLLRMPPHYQYPPQNISIFDVLQQFNKFES